MQVEDHRVGNIPAGHQHILLLPVQRQIKLFVHAADHVGIMLDIIEIANGDDRRDKTEYSHEQHRADSTEYSADDVLFLRHAADFLPVGEVNADVSDAEKDGG